MQPTTSFCRSTCVFVCVRVCVLKSQDGSHDCMILLATHKEWSVRLWLPSGLFQPTCRQPCLEIFRQQTETALGALVKKTAVVRKIFKEISAFVPCVLRVGRHTWVLVRELAVKAFFPRMTLSVFLSRLGERPSSLSHCWPPIANTSISIQFIL